jgi:hypothetical protein
MPIIRHYERIGKTKAILVPPLPDRNPGKRPWGIPASPAGGYPSPAALAAAPAPSGSPPQRLAARPGAAMRGLDMQIRMGEDGDSSVSWRQGIETAGWGKPGGSSDALSDQGQREHGDAGD